jgi:hypothetical protein
MLLLPFFCSAQAEDPSSRVGRLNLTTGSVSLRPGVLDDWSPATVNYPLVEGDELWVDTGAKAELHIGSTAVRLDANTDISFLSLDDHILQIRLPGGSLDLSLRRLDKGESCEVDTPTSSFSLVKPGAYRFDVKSDGDVRIVVYQGESEVTDGEQLFSVEAGQSATVPQSTPGNYTVQPAPPRDDFGFWCADRDRLESTALSTRYVPAEMVGAEDLDRSGSWITIDSYGPAWIPADLPPDWAPYSHGHWAWVEPWGWTWIDDAPWGFAPFHYGRWIHRPDGWVWIPGSFAPRSRPVYAPALVVFVGGGHWGPAGSGGNGIAWFPLGPHEVYVPAYQASPGYIRTLNGPSVPNINPGMLANPPKRYVNMQVTGAMRSVPSQSFGTAQAGPGKSVAVQSGDAAKAPIMGSTATITPRKESVVARRSQGVVPIPPAGLASRSVVARTEPRQAPVAFESRQKALASSKGRPLNPTALRSISKNAPQKRRHPVKVVNKAKLKKINQPQNQLQK